MEATRTVVKVAFEHIKLHRLDLRVLTSNHVAIACYRSCGFKDEGIQRETLFIDGRWESDLWMSILEQEYKEKANQSLQTTATSRRV
ncbi:RimJ/RimL family protein N-acetyltransferase [Puniceicoccus vermicola]